VKVSDLVAQYDAVALAGGAEKPRDLPIPGRELSGVHFAMDFLTANTRAVLDGGKEFTSADGKDVVIIGGGDTGTDCVGTSVRHGCATVTQLEIMAKPPMERAANNPWPEWPKVYKMDYGQEEAAAKFGDDPRVYLTTATHFEGDGEGKVKAVHVVDVEWRKNEQGQFGPQPVAGTERVLPAQLVLLAMGFLGPEQPLLDALPPRPGVEEEQGEALLVWEVVELWLKAQGGRVKPRQLNTPRIIGALPNPGYAV
jgi:glutamate synthase (NADPH/NADH) small chain